MTELSAFPITRKWPPRYPDRIQLYSLNTPNGVKVSIMLEECGLPYEAHLVSFQREDQHSPEFTSLNPYEKIPAIIDPQGPGGKALPLFESGAILMYLAEKSGRFLPKDPVQRWQTIQWIFFQVGGIGPMFGQLGFFHYFSGRTWQDKRPRDRYAAESRTLLAVIDQQLEGREWMMGSEYTIADIAIFPMVNNLIHYYKAGAQVGIADFDNVLRVLDRFLSRSAVAVGLTTPS